MNIENHVRPRAHEHFVAAFEARPTEIRAEEILLLHHSAHGAIEDEDARFERVE